MFSTVEGYRTGEISDAIPSSPATPQPPPLPEVSAAVERSQEASTMTEAAPARAAGLELVDRRIDVPAAARPSDASTRLELRSIEDRLEANRLRTESLSRQLAELTEAETRAADARVNDRATVAELVTTRSRLEERVRDLAEEIADVRQSSAAANEALHALRTMLSNRENAQTSTLARQIAGAYTLAVVALLAAILTLVLMLAR